MSRLVAENASFYFASILPKYQACVPSKRLQRCLQTRILVKILAHGAWSRKDELEACQVKSFYQNYLSLLAMDQVHWGFPRLGKDTDDCKAFLAIKVILHKTEQNYLYNNVK